MISAARCASPQVRGSHSWDHPWDSVAWPQVALGVLPLCLSRACGHPKNKNPRSGPPCGIKYSNRLTHYWSCLGK